MAAKPRQVAAAAGRAGGVPRSATSARAPAVAAAEHGRAGRAAGPGRLHAAPAPATSASRRAPPTAATEHGHRPARTRPRRGARSPGADQPGHSRRRRRQQRGRPRRAASAGRCRKPWAKPQPKPQSAASWAGVSTPSATTSSPQRPADADDRLAQRAALRVPVDPGDQRAVELEDVDGQPGEVGQRGVPLPKSSSATCTPISRSAEMSSAARSSSAATVGAVISSTSRSGGSPERRSAASTSATTVPLAQVAGGTLTARGAAARPPAGRPAATVAASRSTQRMQLPDQAGPLGDRQELGGRHLAPARGAASAAGPRRPVIRWSASDDDRLEQQEELAAGAGALRGRVRSRVPAGGGVAERGARSGARCPGPPRGRPGRRARARRSDAPRRSPPLDRRPRRRRRSARRRRRRSTIGCSTTDRQRAASRSASAASPRRGRRRRRRPAGRRGPRRARWPAAGGRPRPPRR